jgi:hypothetical protein
MTKQMNIDIIANDKTKQALSGVQGNLQKTRQSVLNLRNALIGIGAGAVLKSFVNVGKEVESLRTRFKFLFGSAEEGAIAFDNLTKFAAKVPFSLQEISRASGNLAVVANDATDLNRILEITGNVAAVTGLDFETTSSQIQRAFSGGIGAADLFRERGVRALLGFQNGATVTAEETVARFEELFSGDGRFAKATAALAQTLEGTLSMIGDKYFKFQKTVAENFFDELKQEFGDLNKFLEDNDLEIQAFAKDLGSVLADSIIVFSDAIVLAKENSDLLTNILKTLIGLKIASFALTAAKGFGFLATSILATATSAEVFFNVMTFGLKGAATKVIKFTTDLIDQNDELAPSLLETAKQLKKLFEDLGEFSEGLERLGNDFISAEESAENFQKSMAAVNKAMFPNKNAYKNLDDFLNKNKTTFEKIAEATEDYFKTEIQKLNDKKEKELKVVEDAQKQIVKQLKLIDDEKLKVTDATHQSLIQREKELNSLLLAIDTKYGDEEQKIIKEQNEKALKEQKEYLEELQNLIDEANEKRIEKIREEGSVLDNLKQNYTEFFEEFRANVEIANSLQTAFDGVTRGIGDAVAQSLIFGKSFKETFGNIARQVLAQLISSLVQIGIKMVLNATIGRTLQATALAQGAATAAALSAAYATPAALASLASFGTNAIPAQAGLSSTVALSQILASTGGIPRQNGGQVFAGQMYTVGENGREAFIPNQSGTIVSNDQLNKGTVVNVNIMANDTQGFDDLLIRRRSVIVNVINDALNRQGKEALV